MRSEQIYRVLAQGYSRFEICQLVSKGVKCTHKPGSRFEDTIDSTLSNLGIRPSDHKDVLSHRTFVAAA